MNRHHKDEHHHSNDNKKPFTDPVCGMTTDREGAFILHKYDGRSYYFCSEHCLTKFKAEPDVFIGRKKETAPKPQQSELLYTCPMHPEVIQDGPGTCPKCGMALEPQTVSLSEDEKNPEYEDMRKRFIVGAILTVPLVIIAMRDLIPRSKYSRYPGWRQDL